LVNIGCTANNSAAERKIAAANTRRRRLELLDGMAVPLTRHGYAAVAALSR
jgi:hypothetical protein